MYVQWHSDWSGCRILSNERVSLTVESNSPEPNAGHSPRFPEGSRCPRGSTWHALKTFSQHFVAGERWPEGCPRIVPLAITVKPTFISAHFFFWLKKFFGHDMKQNLIAHTLQIGCGNIIMRGTCLPRTWARAAGTVTVREGLGNGSPSRGRPAVSGDDPTDGSILGANKSAFAGPESLF